ncbi:MAG TPA: beta-ketoacyl synthase N-terminal-like domain-containing protein, partial [Blastocatellia bacterium]|nr:beta-ketoacyl synthase N-terminal-like domain-containing protein [Blastocatellia bacterium]
MKEALIAASVRTPIGRFGGTLKDWTAADLGVAVVGEALARAGVDPESVNETIIGNARQAGGGPNVGRQISYRAGIPDAVPAYTVNKACGSGLKAIVLAAEQIMLGRAELVVAGGTESMSRVPYLADGARWGLRLGNVDLVDGMYRDGFLDPLSGQLMGETAETLARRYDISREEQDAFALRSQQRAESAIKEGRFGSELISLKIKDKKGVQTEFTLDEH